MESTLHVKAASITGGIIADYFQFLLEPSPGNSGRLIGASPFGDGLHSG